MIKAYLTSIILFIFISQGRAEEPNWDKIIPIIIQLESSGNLNVISKKGCRGLMQISEAVLEEFNSYCIDKKITHINKSIEHSPLPQIPLKTIDLYIPEINITVGTWYLKRIWHHYLKGKGTIDDMLICYNFGYGNWLKYKQGKKKLPYETKQYIKKFWRLYNER